MRKEILYKGFERTDTGYVKQPKDFQGFARIGTLLGPYLQSSKSRKNLAMALFRGNPRYYPC